ncbi:phosphoketolase family protein [Rhizobium sp. P40RR-XXII]|uniref:phosphoketolase family protein n=1 Tax=Rhizobium sp. P40RR-XXII TaxID=2726739 RepID=UPI001457306B|nr:phosphoketolase family protein [Rhizobium sp. P40RR-XXII]NLS18700.1 phosphoketolase family protein [Rhizobium sp. P40RR-XXII]
MNTLFENHLPAIPQDELLRMHAWWRAANYLNVGQIYLRANPLLKEKLTVEHIKPRLLGHWGTSPGLNLVYVHLNRLIKKYDLDTIYMAGPGHGGPAIIANVWLEGSYSEFYPEITNDETGMLKLFRQFSTPGGIPSHVSVPTPGSIHEGGELGYVLLHAFGAVMDNSDLLVAAVVGDGESETGPLAGSWKSIDFINPKRDGAVLPILHLNGYKISGPTVWARHSDEDLRKFFEGQGYAPCFVEGDDPMIVHQSFGAAMEKAVLAIRAIQKAAREDGADERPRWPLIVLRTPKGWTGPKIVDGIQVEGTFRSHQVPVADILINPEHLHILEAWMRSYKPEELFDDHGAFRPEYAALAPEGKRRMGSNPQSNGGELTQALKLPNFEEFQVKFEQRARERLGSTQILGSYIREIYRNNPTNFRLFCPDETNSNRLGAVFDVSDRGLMSEIRPGDDHISHDGRVMEVLSEHCCHGWLEGYNLTGRHGLFATYEAFAMIVDSMAMQHAKWIEHAERVSWRAPIPSLNYLLTSTCWRNDHNGFSHQGPGFIDTIIHRKPAVARVYLPPDANCLLSVADHCFTSRNYLNLIVIDKQPQLQWLTMEEAKAHCAKGAGVWDMYSNQPDEPDIVLACAGDIPTQETIAAAWLLRRYAPDLKVRVANVVDLMRLCSSARHPHGMSDTEFTGIFTTKAPVIFAFHGYPGVIHDLLHGREAHDQFHVRGYLEEGTTTTPFDMVVLNRISRLHLCLDVLRYVPDLLVKSPELAVHCKSLLEEHDRYIREHFDDLPEIRDWVWSD